LEKLESMVDLEFANSTISSSAAWNKIYQLGQHKVKA
jgi:hypothetical protein